MTAGFRALTRVASLLNEGDEQSARDAYIRFLDAFSGTGQMQDAANALGMRLGLFPYVQPTADGLSESEALALAYHSPQVFAAYGFSFHSEQQRVYERLLDGENVILSAPTSFGKSCGIWRFLAVFRGRSLSLVADDEDARGGFDDVGGDDFELVDLRTQVIRGIRQSRSRKLPGVMRAIAAIVWASVKSSGSSERPRRFQWRSITKRGSSRPRAR